ncbi:predicted protein [Naegleria gruberi]|uniref:Predicted protein n=1 Tax=Naegleria gruberi TaxID=5762 RepID=D2W2R2_NAEGR|nr:uncharacterized protein NAEGRDRAFT_75679 [Naegleria gruberi]EFC36691.1 predicted protein [Naegleria gruberi]|eukprot:XP_002669435.1 predicted protein [Naegleria gruberi strain NEG-M]
MSLLFEEKEYRKLILETFSFVYLWVANFAFGCWNTLTSISASSVQLDILGSSFSKSKDISLSGSGNSFSPVSSDLYNIISSNHSENNHTSASPLNSYTFPSSGSKDSKDGEDSSTWVETISSVCDSVFSVSPDLTSYDEALFETDKVVRRGSILSNENLAFKRNSRRMTIDTVDTLENYQSNERDIRIRSKSAPMQRDFQKRMNK